LDNDQILSIFLRGALGSRGRKRARRAARFLSGKRGFLSASALLGAAGVAWGIFDSLKGAADGTPGVPGTVGPTAVPGSPGPPLAVPPPLPAPSVSSPPAAASINATDPRGLSFDVIRVVRLAVSAARADGSLLPAERALILSHAREAGVEGVVEEELSTSRPLAEILAGVFDEQRRRELYVIAFTIVRADESVTGAERIYLAQLAHHLGLDAETVAALERETAIRIDDTPDAPE
jgi:hypothetical protein